MVKRSALVIILGTSASGKTSLATRLAESLQIPCLGKDAVKEALFDSLGSGDREWSRSLSRASLEVIVGLARIQLRAGLACMVEGNWRERQAARFEPLLDAGIAAAQIRCHAEPAEIARRFHARRRHPGHLDALLAAELAHEVAAELARESAAPAGNRAGSTGFLELPGPRWSYRSDAADAEAAYGELAATLGRWLRGL